MIYVLSDIHGNMARLNSLLKQINLQPDDTLYNLGDNIDRFPDGIRIIRMFMKMPNVKMLRGNHERMMLDYFQTENEELDSVGIIRRIRAVRLWYDNGGAVTHSYLKHIKKSVRQEVFDYLENLPLYYDVEAGGKKYRLVHAADPDEYGEYDRFYKSREEFSVWFRPKNGEDEPENYTLIAGHTPTVYFQEYNPLSVYTSKSGKRIYIDCGCGFAEPDSEFPFRGRLACLRLDDGRIFYSEN